MVISSQAYKEQGMRKRLGVGLVALTISTAACDSLLDVELPGQLPEESLLVPEMTEMMTLGSIADFECAYTSYILGAAGASHEYIDASGWPAFIVFPTLQVFEDTGGVNTSGCTGATSFGFFRPLQTARFQAEQAFTTIEGFTTAQVPRKDGLLATSAAIAGFVYATFGESWCEMAVNGGGLMTPAAVLTEAEGWFDKSITHAAAAGGTVTAAGIPNVLHFARLGRARVRLARGNKAGAAEDAALVPENFLATITRSSGTRDRWNNVYVNMTPNRYVTVGPNYRNLTVNGVADPRVRVVNSGTISNDGVTPHWNQLKYTSDVQPIPLARWAEAQLILAEVKGGAAAVGHINAVRARSGITPYAGGTEAQIQAQIIEERRREFFLEGRRHADMLRYKVPFPTGNSHRGQPYGPTTCFPLSKAEKDTNPNI